MSPRSKQRSSRSRRKQPSRKRPQHRSAKDAIRAALLGSKGTFIALARANPSDPVARKALALLAAIERQPPDGEP